MLSIPVFIIVNCSCSSAVKRNYCKVSLKDKIFKCKGENDNLYNTAPTHTRQVGSFWARQEGLCEPNLYHNML